MKTIDDYKSLKYPIELIETDEGVVVSHPDLPGCHSFGETISDAIKNLDEVRLLWLEGYFKAHGSAPEPRDDEDYSGKFVLRVPKWLHRALEKTAKREGISLNQLAVSLLSKGVTDKTTEAVSLQLCVALEQVRGQLANICGAPRIFVGSLEVGKAIPYSIQGFTKNVAAFECNAQSGSVVSSPSLTEDEEALSFVYGTFPSRFESKIQMTGKRR
jgi:predicted RNase H-like HicB family nuclease